MVTQENKVRENEGELIKPTEGMAFTKVLSEIRRMIKPQEGGAEVSSIPKRTGDVIFIEVDSRATGKGLSCD